VRGKEGSFEFQETYKRLNITVFFNNKTCISWEDWYDVNKRFDVLGAIFIYDEIIKFYFFIYNHKIGKWKWKSRLHQMIEYY